MNKKIMAFCIGSMMMGACSSSVQKKVAGGEGDSLCMLAGSYATPDEEGVRVYRFNEETGEATYVSGLKGISNPSYLVPSADGSRVYAVGEDEGPTATLHALRLDSRTGTLEPLNAGLTGGGSPCYVTLDPSDHFALTANYMGGSITVYALDGEGCLQPDTALITFSGSSIDRERQAQPHLHCVRFTPDGRYLLADDLGMDRIHVFPVCPEATSAATLLDKEHAYDIEVEPGSGPRHLCFHPGGKFAYLINELSGTVVAFAYDAGQLDALQYIHADTVGARGSADIHLSPDGKFLYASNRLQADGVAVFSVDAKQGILKKVGYQPTGNHPRNFILTPNGRYLLVACRDTDEIQVYRRDSVTGLLADTGKRIPMKRPVCLRFL